MMPYYIFFFVSSVIYLVNDRAAFVKGLLG